MNARRCALAIVCSAVVYSRSMFQRDGALSDSSPFGSFLDKLYSFGPMFRLDQRALDEAKDAGIPAVTATSERRERFPSHGSLSKKRYTAAMRPSRAMMKSVPATCGGSPAPSNHRIRPPSPTSSGLPIG